MTYDPVQITARDFTAKPLADGSVYAEYLAHRSTT